MKILITGAKGFIGKNIVSSLECIKSGTDQIHRINNLENESDLQIVTYDIDSITEELEAACRDCDAIIHLAGVNRPLERSEFMEGNCKFTNKLISLLKKYHNSSPILFASSIQASLADKYKNSEYGRSKLASEKILLAYAEETGAKVLIYRFPNIFGKWCKPHYNSVVATFCNNIANDLPIQISDINIQLELLYIDDLVNEIFDALNGNEHHCEYEGVNIKAQADGRYCFVPLTYKKTLGEIVDLLKKYQDRTIMIPEMPEDSFEKKLYATYLSYLPADRILFPLKMNIDERGSFTELIRTSNSGQLSVNICKPGVIKGQHWHHTKCEIFIVVSGRGLIQQRRYGVDEKGIAYPRIEHEVTGDKIEAVYILPGYVHNITNLSKTEDMITFIWASEPFDHQHPDTFFEQV